jgi:hypothetical protein
VVGGSRGGVVEGGAGAAGVAEVTGSSREGSSSGSMTGTSSGSMGPSLLVGGEAGEAGVVGAGAGAGTDEVLGLLGPSQRTV